MSGTPKSYLDEGKMQQIFYLDEGLLRKLKAYAMETGQTFQELISPEFSNFEQSLILKSTEIDKIRLTALEATKKLIEDQKIAAEHPYKAIGHEVDPIGNIKVEEPITQ